VLSSNACDSGKNDEITAMHYLKLVSESECMRHWSFYEVGKVLPVDIP
jgi:hypothetical protein